MLVLATQAYLYIYLGDGPVWPKSINVADKCHTDWWKHLLYVNNLVGVDGEGAEDQVLLVHKLHNCACFILILNISADNVMGLNIPASVLLKSTYVYGTVIGPTKILSGR